MKVDDPGRRPTRRRAASRRVLNVPLKIDRDVGRSNGEGVHCCSDAARFMMPAIVLNQPTVDAARTRFSAESNMRATAATILELSALGSATARPPAASILVDKPPSRRQLA